ncbi:peptide ABC transporter substrate-binding protein [Candidatus Oscillochloris fontis]|uniref:peptide ABC transporter substrate-binding protein n=1 Tax=Candidatus Oscillochloris fontis TaxID=2496868 RepID=UPI001583DE06|nr:peptide ABC transporter substrate-binding protein [Candidatus Oscillochloris fontis]
MLRKRIWTLIVVGMLAATLLSACSAPPPVGSPTLVPTVAESAVAEPTVALVESPTPAVPSSGGTLKILYSQAITVLNPYLSSGSKDLDGATIILEPLAHYNQDDQLVPALAAEIPSLDNGGIADDYRSITWKLKPDVLWSDGTPFTAQDVVFTWRYCTDVATGCVWTSLFANVEQIEALDAATVKITWKQPTPNPFTTFVSRSGLILQQAQFANCIGANAMQDANCQAANLAPIGTNAYKLKEFRPGDTVLYAQNPNYRDAANTAFDQIEIKGGGDPASAARAVCETGEADFTGNLQVTKAVLDPILAAGMCDTVAGGSAGVERINFNFSNPDPALGAQRSEPDQPNPILSDLRVRQAITKAIDRQMIADQLFGTSGVPTCNISVIPQAYASTSLTCARDLEAAKALLDEAGWLLPEGGKVRERDGKPLRLSFQTNINALRQSEQAIIKSNLADVGIQVDLEAYDSSVFFGSAVDNEHTMHQFFADLQMYSNRPMDYGLDSYFQAWICAEVNSVANQWTKANDLRYCNPAYDALYNQFISEFDSSKRAELAMQLNDFLINDAVVIPLINRLTPNAKAKSLVGPTHSSFDSMFWNIATWKRVP